MSVYWGLSGKIEPVTRIRSSVHHPLRRHRSAGVWLAVSTATLALSACSSSTPGLLSQSDIPSDLGVKYNPSAGPDARSLRLAPCRKPASAVVATFTSGKPVYPIVNSLAVSCPNVSQAQMFFDTRKVGARGYPIPRIKGHSFPGIGDEAWIVDEGGGSDLRDYSLAWRQGNRVSSVTVEGLLSDKRITPALAELLARRAAARS